jgi:hypothetical protein
MEIMTTLSQLSDHSQRIRLNKDDLWEVIDDKPINQ